MYSNNIVSKLRVNLSNIPGWRTKRKIVVLESDDWGSVRSFNADSVTRMRKAGLEIDKTHYDAVDSLESNHDLETLFSVLSEFKDVHGHYAKFTPMCLVANPDFNKIKESGFSKYAVEPLEQTLKYYPAHDKVLDLWRKGFEENLFYPALHGREHINVRRYISLLMSGDAGIRVAFDNFSVGVSSYNGKAYPNYLGALHPESTEEVKELHEILIDAGRMFLDYMGYEPTCFIAPNREEPKELERTLHKIGVKYLTRSKNRLYPVGDGTFKKEFNWLGKKNEFGQRMIVRNCFFEPVAWGEHLHVTDWVDNCLKEIQIAFRWGKPAVISTHRVNYVGHIDRRNGEKGIRELRRLLKSVLKYWPGVEFKSTFELGKLLEN